MCQTEVRRPDRHPDRRSAREFAVEIRAGLIRREIPENDALGGRRSLDDKPEASFLRMPVHRNDIARRWDFRHHDGWIDGDVHDSYRFAILCQITDSRSVRRELQ